LFRKIFGFPVRQRFSYGWPGPIYEGDGECQAVVDERADDKQREALAAIMYGNEDRKVRVVIDDVLESTARPIKSPATGAEHRVRICLPNGIEFDLAEIASGTTKTVASIALDLKDSYFHFNAIRQSGTGLIRSRLEPSRPAW
jgi:hypothetical protein